MEKPQRKGIVVQRLPKTRDPRRGTNKTFLKRKEKTTHGTQYWTLRNQPNLSSDKPPTEQNGMEGWFQQLEQATLASLATFDEVDATLAFLLLRDPTASEPGDLPMGPARDRLSTLFSFPCAFPPSTCPARDSPPPDVLLVGGPCSLGVLLASTILRAATRAEGYSDLGALVAGSGVPSAPLPSEYWARAVCWLNRHCAGHFAGGTLPFVSWWAHLAHWLGVSIHASSPHAPLGTWTLRASGRCYVENRDICDDIRKQPCPLAAVATLLMEQPIRVWGPGSSFVSTTRRVLSTLVSGGLPLAPDGELMAAERRGRAFYICEMTRTPGLHQKRATKNDQRGEKQPPQTPSEGSDGEDVQYWLRTPTR